MQTDALAEHVNLPDSQAPSSITKAGVEVLGFGKQSIAPGYCIDAGIETRSPQPVDVAGSLDVKVASTKVNASGADFERPSSLKMEYQLDSDRELIDSLDALDGLVQQDSHIHVSVFYRLIKKCKLRKDLVLGKRVHALVVESGYGSNLFLANHLICMYANHGKLKEAMQVFSTVVSPDCHMWSSIILAYARHEQPKEAIKLYRRMKKSPLKPDNHVFGAVLKACANASDLVFGKEVHSQLLGSALEPDMFVNSCLVDMYVKCGSIQDARKVFDALCRRDVVLWNCMIAGYAQHGLGQDALDLYAEMQDGMCTPSSVTFLPLLQVCGHMEDLRQGKNLHAQIKQRGLEDDVAVGSALITMYSKCGSLEDAREVFNSLPTRDVVTWTTMITEYAEHGQGQEALALYAAMQQNGMCPANSVTFVCLLRACTNAGALHQGKELHAQIRQRELEIDVIVGTCLVDMYAKCGRLEDAREVFDKLPTKDVVVWNALLNGYAESSSSQRASELFKEMREEGVEPDAATFLSLLKACSHDGQVDEGESYFRGMVEDYGLKPTASHYNCMVDLLGRAGHLSRAEDMLRAVACDKDVVGWTSLLSACKSHGSIDLGRRCFDQIIKAEPENASAYVLLATIYANAGRWRDAHEVESMRKSVGAKKKPAKACIEVHNKVQEFTVGDDKGDMSLKLRKLNLRLKREGHVPQTDLVLRAVSEAEKEDALCGHAEKLALAYGLMNTPDGTTLLVSKNLRMCNDCHSSTKVLSLLEKREIVVRDAHRVHRFAEGHCSCGDRH